MKTLFSLLLLGCLSVLASTKAEAKCASILFTIEGDLIAAPSADKGTNIEVVIPQDSWVVEKPKYEGTRFTVTVAFYPGVDNPWYRWFGENCSGRPNVIYVRVLENNTILDTVTLLPSPDFSTAGERRFITRRRVLLRNR